MKFDECARKWHTAKVFAQENPLSHTYGPTYERLLEGREIKRILEIGIGWQGLFHRDYVTGGSLKMWAELYPDAEIFGLDIRLDTMVNEGKIRSLYCDTGSKLLLRDCAKQIGAPLDLVVDDGSHVTRDQIWAAEIFVPLLSPHGIYIVEDLLTPDLDLPWKHEVIELDTARVNDDRLLVIRAEDVRAADRA